ncbi:AMP-binding protein [Teichococcus rhizosphaerae]|uniref:AMP-binding protein n=1 Tax=Teichococcus rhizosphaerae TaxID=1335062 RepID=UPI003461F928
MRARSSPPAGRRPAADDVVQILFTSGTTGEPKGVMHTSNTLFSNVRGYIGRIGLGAADVLMMSSPMAHQTGFMYGLMAPILLGAKVVLQDIWQPEEAADLIEAEGVTFTMASTPFLSDLAEVGARRPASVRSLRMFLSAGAPIPRVLARRAAESLGATIISAWGMTENGATTTTRPDDPPEKAFETDGCPLPGVELRVVDAEASRCRPIRRAGCRSAAPAISSAICAGRNGSPRTPRAGSRPATSRAWMRTAMSASPAAPRTSSSAAARTFPSSRWRA